MKTRVLFVLALFLFAVAGCSVFRAESRLASAAPAAATPAPLVITVVVTPTPGPVAAETIDADRIEAGRIAVYERVAPAVVNVTTQVLRSSFFRGAIPEEGSGSGFLWDAQGHIVTNNHVVEGAQRIEVSFGGDASQSATVVGTDPVNDLAVIKVDSVPEGVRPLELGASAGLKVGQTAIVIGNPFGQFERTMTQGIISAVNRTLQTDTTVLRGVIQTDAAINRGNSGGPLLDSHGRLIGVNSAIFSPTGTSAGVGLAIPVDKARRVVPVLIKQGRFPHPWLGIEGLGYELSPGLVGVLKLPVQSGLLLAQMYQGSPADKAGLRKATDEMLIGNRRYLTGGDILIAVDGTKLSKWDDLSAYLEEKAEVGQTVALKLVRDGKELTIKVTLVDTPESLR
jgi:S1-C subfamily serine protease